MRASLDAHAPRCSTALEHGATRARQARVRRHAVEPRCTSGGPELRYLRALRAAAHGRSRIGGRRVRGCSRAPSLLSRTSTPSSITSSRVRTTQLQHFDKAVRARVHTSRRLHGRRGSPRTRCPSRDDAPETDAPGDAEKGWQQQFGALDANLDTPCKKGLDPLDSRAQNAGYIPLTQGFNMASTTKIAINGFGRIGRCVARVLLRRAGTATSSWSPSTTSPTPRRSRTCSSSTRCTARSTARSKAEDGALDHRRQAHPDLRREGPGQAALEGRSASTSCSSARASSRTQGEGDGAPQGGREARDHQRARRQPTSTAPSASASTSTRYDAAKHVIVSNASCTTNCLAPDRQGAARHASAS